ncbi:MarR family winged helix-turn-helix transcriptional regulator [Ferviditalea candida]|uniref:MarR family transcriptional regulator n=1 Tax=Ferviditalea candida TaxID=3108399 RepID=A0ABU5ZJ41_9BACL|nr:MarR family transcriptional regulator [Paenibacillaceae bacterium T2]
MYAQEFSKLWQKISKDLRTYMETELAPTLTEGQLNVLEYLLAHEQVKPSDLIEYVSTTPAAVTTLLDRMEKNELIARERDEADRRIVWIRLTAKGREEGMRGSRIRQQFLEQVLNRISAHNQQLLIYLLGKISKQ